MYFAQFLLLLDWWFEMNGLLMDKVKLVKWIDGEENRRLDLCMI